MGTKEGIIETMKISLPQMVDVAINSGEAGLVNFNLLHALLQVVIQQCNLSGCQVEFRGDDSVRLANFIKATAKTSPNLTLTEYIVAESAAASKKAAGTTPSGTHVPAKQAAVGGNVAPESVKVQGKVIPLTEEVKKEISRQEVKKEKQLRVIQRRKNSQEEPSPAPEPLKSPSPSAYSLDKLVVVETAGNEKPQFSVALTRSQFEAMQKSIDELRLQVKDLTGLPSALGLLEAIKGEDGKPALTDFFQLLTISKRMDAAELSMEKLANMMQDMVKDFADGGFDFGGLKEVQQRLDVVEKNLGVHEVIISRPTSARQKPPERELSAPPPTTDESPPASEAGDRKEKKKKKKAKTGSDSSTSSESVKSDKVPITQKPSNLEGVDLTEISTAKAMELIQKELVDIRCLCEYMNPEQMVNDVEEIKRQLSSDMDTLPPQIQFSHLENKFSACQDQLNSLDTMYNHQMSVLQGQLEEVERQLAGTLERINAGGFATRDDGGENEASLVELYDKIVQMQEEINSISESTEKLMDEKMEKEATFNALVEQIDLLKQTKADREDLEDALADKADACMINRKVSTSQFNAACDDLSRGIEEALSKLTQQELMWQTALDDLQREVGSKLDKVELTPLQNFINNKLKALQEKFKTLTALKKESEAAGTKSKLLRNVNCISCDKDVTMKKEVDQSMLPQAPALPPKQNMGPYLAYELDQLRKQQKSVPKGKNLNYLENAMSTKQPKDKNHLCNRYCGGSHTTTTPQQRVTRLGHFLQQYGPEIVPVTETTVKGDDGFMYKGAEQPTTATTSEPPSQPVPDKDLPEKQVTPEGQPSSPPAAAAPRQSAISDKRSSKGHASVEIMAKLETKSVPIIEEGPEPPSKTPSAAAPPVRSAHSTAAAASSSAAATPKVSVTVTETSRRSSKRASLDAGNVAAPSKEGIASRESEKKIRETPEEVPVKDTAQEE